MKIAVIGSRTLPDTPCPERSELIDQMLEFIDKNIDIDELEAIVSGGARGADALGKQLALSFYDCGYIEHIAQWDKHGKAAGPKRNALIAQTADVCFAFIDKPLYQSKGTKNCVWQFKKLQKPIFILDVKESTNA